ncbi:hypothetical protein MKX03_032030 [Papaver bracteatum]|nr:hypothetical protein MKX03_032030 [Papaver bracteatum]
MEHTYQYAWIIPFVPLPVPIAIGVGLLLVPTTTKNIRRFWAFLSVLLLSIVMLFSIDLSIQQMNEFGDLIDPLTSIMLILITTVGIMVLIYSDNYMSHDEGYLIFFAYMSFSNTSMLGLVTSSNLIQIYIFWELVGMCSYLLIGYFGLLLGILGLCWITGSFEFRVTKYAQFSLHVWLPDAMEGPTPISALIHAATTVAAGIFLVDRLYPLFTVIPYIMNLISLIGIITGWGSYRAALFHLITHAYSKAILILGSGSIIHSTLSFCGIPPLVCFWSKDEILSDSWVYSPIFAIIAYFTAGLTAFYNQDNVHAAVHSTFPLHFSCHGTLVYNITAPS